MSRLHEKIAIVTGGTSGIGLASAKLFANEGAKVFVIGRRQKELDAAVVSVGSGAVGLQCDVSNLAELALLYEKVRTSAGHIDVLFANAGIASFLPLGAIDEAHFDSIFDLNVRGTLFTVQGALPLLHDGASIVITGSIAASKGIPNTSVYSASKAALRAFARSWAVELKDRRIRTNILSPGTVATPPVIAAGSDVTDHILAGVPMGRMASPEEIARVALFLASDESSYLTGTEIFADGGAAQV